MSSQFAEDDEAGVLRETRDTPPVHYLLKIVSFSLLSKHGMDKIKSNKFQAGEHQWNIVLFPEGTNRGKGDHVSVYLMLASTSSLPAGKCVKAFFKFFLLDQIRGNYLTVQGRVKRFDKVKSEWGLSKFISLKDMKEPSNGFLLNDTSFLGVEVFFTEGSCLGESFSISKDLCISGKYQWLIDQYSELGEECYSDEFVVGGYRWKILLYPRGLAAFKDFSICLYLSSVDSLSCTTENKVKAKFVLRLKDPLSQKHIQKEDMSWFGASIKDWGWKSFIELKDLKDSERGYLIRDQCIIEAEVTVLCETYQKTLDF